MKIKQSIITFWQWVSSLGVKADHDFIFKKQIISTNRIALFIGSLTLLSYWAIVIYALISKDPKEKLWDDYNLFLTGAMMLMVLILNYHRKYNLAKILISVTPTLSITILPITTNTVANPYIFITPIILICLSTLPHFLYSFRTKKGFYLGLILFHFLLLVTVEELYVYFSDIPKLAYEYKQQLFFFIKLSEIVAFVSAHIIIGYSLNLNERYYNDLNNTISEITQKNQTISVQKSSLINQQKNIKKIQKNLQERNQELHEQRETLIKQNENLNKLLKQLKVSQMQLVHTEKMATLGKLTAGIAHEVNNPLNFIKSGLTGLNEGINRLLSISKRLDDSSNDHVDQILKDGNFSETLELVERIPKNIKLGVNRALDVIKELKSFNDDNHQEKLSTNLQKILDSSLLLLNNQIKSKIEIVKSFHRIPSILAVPNQIHQVFMNILSNAIEAVQDPKNTSKKQMIFIETILFSDGSNEYIKVSIQDSGIGIPKADQPNIFEPFVSSKPAGKGMGLGLSIASQIIAAHGGKIEFHSDTNYGTCFYVILPVYSTIS